MFELVNTEDNEKIEFGEFVQATCTYCMFEPPEVLKFVFYIFDKDKNGYIGQDELGNFIEQLHQEKIQGNLEKALEELDSDLEKDLKPLEAYRRPKGRGLSAPPSLPAVTGRRLQR